MKQHRFNYMKTCNYCHKKLNYNAYKCNHCNRLVSTDEDTSSSILNSSSYSYTSSSDTGSSFDGFGGGNSGGGGCTSDW